MSNLNNLLDQVKSPEPSDLLKARILQQAKAQRADKTVSESGSVRAANDNHWKRWGGLAVLVIILGAVGINTLSPVQTNETEVWAETAQTMGYEYLYAWVEGDAVESNEAGAEIEVGNL